MHARRRMRLFISPFIPKILTATVASLLTIIIFPFSIRRQFIHVGPVDVAHHMRHSHVFLRGRIRYKVYSLKTKTDGRTEDGRMKKINFLRLVLATNDAAC